LEGDGRGMRRGFNGKWMESAWRNVRWILKKMTAVKGMIAGGKKLFEEENKCLLAESIKHPFLVATLGIYCEDFKSIQAS
jgi:hypothetical protein